MSREQDLERIAEGLRRAATALEPFTPGKTAYSMKNHDDPVTAADLAVDAALRDFLPAEGEGWLSEETRDDAARLSCSRVWIVDPVDGTKEFVQGIPEWCVSIGLVEEGRPIAGGLVNPIAGQTILGAEGLGVSLNGEPARPRHLEELAGAEVLSSRSEIKRGEWARFEGEAFSIKPCGSVAWKLAQVAAGLADCTWTLVPKNEWDVAAGAACLLAAGGDVRLLDGRRPTFNRRDTLYTGFIAAPSPLMPAILDLLEIEALDV